ncbi:MAG TPA: adenosylcobalamin-dependent ribonucleoside-diphosphate reductase, partial [Candidatus Babeliales bacterium]|nr:adenosylcobalamin-dependent ribonucleoside-diphosphate reductase [Candidatus Babeliales bacterium]
MFDTDEELQMKFARTYSAPGDPYSGVKFEPRSSKIVNPDGSVIFEASDVMVPSTWSQVAVDVLAQKYCRKAGVPKATKRVSEEGVPEWLQRSVADGPALDAMSRDEQFGSERDARQVFNRMAGCWAYWGWKHGYFDSEDDAQVYYDEMCAMLARQIGAPNSPQWFNTGLHWAYGISGPAQGHWFVDAADGVAQASPDTFSHPQVSACYILGIEDDLVNEGGLFDGVIREARIFKGGSGSGANFSKIRAAGEKLTGGGTSSGLMSFLKVFDRAAGAIKSGGTTRRAAKMVVLNADHPDIEEFVNWKVREERKVADLVIGSRMFEKHLNAIISAAHDTRVPEHARLDPALNGSLRNAIREAIAAGVPSGATQSALDYARQGYTRLEVEQYDTAWDSEAYTTVSGQNSNNSVRLTNGFFEALDRDDDWLLTARTTGDVVKRLKARDLWEQIGVAAWQCADPGLQFDDTIQEWHTCSNDERINATNPCSEFVWVDDSACNLASLNLVKFLNDDGNFDAQRFADATRTWTTTLEISVAMGQMPSKRIAEKNHGYRTLGLGYANLGTLLMRMGLPYDSEESFGWCGAINALQTGMAYRTSAEIAQKLGPFARFEANREPMLRVIRNHRRAAYAVDSSEYEGLSVKPVTHMPTLFTQKTWALARKMWDEALSIGEVAGYRNSQVTVTAPTGTIGLVMDCD